MVLVLDWVEGYSESDIGEEGRKELWEAKAEVKLKRSLGWS